MHTRRHLRQFLWLYQHKILFVTHFQDKLAKLVGLPFGHSVLTAELRKLCLLSDPSFWRRKKLKYIFFLFCFGLVLNQWPNSSPSHWRINHAGWLINSVQVVIDFNYCHYPSAPFSCPPQTGQIALAWTTLKMKF